VGGGGTIARSIQPIVEAQGGQFLLNREVTQVLIEGDRAVGVQVRKVNDAAAELETYYAPTIVSNAGVATTYLKLIPSDYPIPFRDELKRFIQNHAPTTNVTLYVGLANDPRSLGFQGENHWIYESIDHNQAFAQHQRWVRNGQPPQCYVSFPSLKDPKATAHTAEIIAWADYETFGQWQTQPWLHRDEDYQQLKHRISEMLIQQVDRHYPGFAQQVAYAELSTPLTNEHFTGHLKGGIYGLPSVPEKFAPQHTVWMKAETPVRGLYLTGADLYMGGIVSAMMAGVTTLSCIPGGISFPQAFATAARQNRNLTNPRI
jgi:phytoene dehydrogenase-like protein